jgi:hypothetical protein
MTVNSFAISAWVNSTSTATGNNNGIFYKRGTGSPISEGYRLCMPNGAFNIHIADGITSNALSAGSGYNDGKWHNVVANIIRTSVLELYVDGVIIGSAASTMSNTISSSSLNIYASIGCLLNAYHFFDGYIGNVQMHNRPLSSSDIVKNFNCLRDRYNV